VSVVGFTQVSIVVFVDGGTIRQTHPDKYERRHIKDFYGPFVCLLSTLHQIHLNQHTHCTLVPFPLLFKVPFVGRIDFLGDVIVDSDVDMFLSFAPHRYLLF